MTEGKVRLDGSTDPEHYTYGRIQPIEVIEDWKLDHHRACAVKYICRAGRKGDAARDLEKARWYIDRAIQLAAKSKGEQA